MVYFRLCGRATLFRSFSFKTFKLFALVTTTYTQFISFKVLSYVVFCFLVVYSLGQLYCVLFKYCLPTVDYFTDFQSVLQSLGSEYNAPLMEATGVNQVILTSSSQTSTTIANSIAYFFISEQTIEADSEHTIQLIGC